MANYKLPKNSSGMIIDYTFEHLKYAPYSQACIMKQSHKLSDARFITLFSYSTPIIVVDVENNLLSVSEYVDCTATTRKHVNRFCKEMNEFLGIYSLSYYWLKTLKNKTINFATGEVIIEDNSNLNMWRNTLETYYNHGGTRY